MQKEKDREKKKRDPLPEAFDSISEAASFWDSHDSTDYEDIMEEVKFDITRASAHVFCSRHIKAKKFQELRRLGVREGIRHGVRFNFKSDSVLFRAENSDIAISTARTKRIT